MRETIAKFTTKGIVRTEMKLLNAVNVTERAVSPLARCVIRFEVAPPGQAASIITPTAISGFTGKIFTRVKAINGNRIN